MAQKTIQLPSGETVTVEVPEGATDEQVLRFVKSQFEAGKLGSNTQANVPKKPQSTQQPQQKGNRYGVTDYLTMAPELVGSMITGALGQVAGGLSGLASAPFVGGAQAGDVVEKVSSALTYEPRNQLTKDVQQVIGETLQPVAQWVSEKPAEAAYDLAKSKRFQSLARASGDQLLMAVADNPAIAASAGATVIPAMLEVIGLKGISRANSKADFKRSVAEKIANNEIDMETINYALSASGKVMDNPRTRQFQKLYGNKEAGARASLTFEQLGPADRAQVIKMLDMVQEGRQKGRAYIMENRPADIIGQGISARIDRLLRIRDSASAKMNDAIGELRTKQVDLSPEADSFINRLSDLGVAVSRGKDGLYKVDTRQSTISMGDAIKSRDIEQILNNLDSGVVSGAKAHQIKKLAQEAVDYGKTFTGKKSSAQLENAVKELAANLNRRIRPLSANYAKANDTYASMAEVLQQAQKRLGGIDIESELASKRFGNLSKRIASNFTSRDEIIGLVDGLDGALAQNGIRMKSNIKKQVAALAELEELFKLEKQQSPFGFQGRIETAMQGMGDPNVLAVRGVDKAIDKIRSMRQPDFDERVAAVKRMLQEQQK